MRVGLTGGSGVVGTAILRHLVGAGHEVKALARSTVSGSTVADAGAVPVPGDVLDHQAVRGLVDGCELVFHTAGVNEMCSSDPDHMWRVNVEGSRMVVDACRDAGVSRLVHTSSAVTIGEGHGEIATEFTNHRGFYLSEYERSKTEAERLVFAEARGVDVVAVNPSSVQGPGRATGTGRLFLAGANGQIRFAVRTTISLVDIDDCARGHLLAADEGVGGERYLLSGAAVSVEEGLAMLSRITGVTLTPTFINARLLSGLATVPEIVYGWLGRQPPLCRESVRVMTHGHSYDGSRATRDLGLIYTPLEQTIERTVAWFRSQGMIRSASSEK